MKNFYILFGNIQRLFCKFHNLQILFILLLIFKIELSSFWKLINLERHVSKVERSRIFRVERHCLKYLTASHYIYFIVVEGNVPGLFVSIYPPLCLV